MARVYPGPFENNIENIAGRPIWAVYRSGYMPLQDFASEHPEYSFFWNWEMDIRYMGQYYELFDRVGSWAKKKPRNGLWERSSKFYIPAVHGTWEDFSTMI